MNTNGGLDGTDILLLVAYVLLIMANANKITTRQGIASVVGYTILVIAKRLEYSLGKTDDLVIRTKRIGYMALFFTPAFSHWYDILAVLGYAFCVLGYFDESATPLAIYHALGAMRATSPLYIAGRAGYSVALSLGWKSPLQ